MADLHDNCYTPPFWFFCTTRSWVELMADKALCTFSFGADSHPPSWSVRWLMHKWLKCKILHTVLPWFMQMDVGKFFPHSKCGSHTHLHFLITHDNCSQMLFRILLSQILYFTIFSKKRSKNDLLSVTVGRYLNLPTYIMPRTNCFSICDSIWYHSLPTFFSLEFRQKNVLKCLHFLFI